MFSKFELDLVDIEKLTDYKNKSIELFNRYSDGVHKYWLSDHVKSMRECGSMLSFGYNSEGAVEFKSNFCRCRFCPLCQYRRSLRLYSNMMTVIESFGGDYDYLHLVLTVPNTSADKLSVTIKAMQTASCFLFSGMHWEGVSRALEITFNHETRLYHPHFHCLVAVKPSYFNSRYYCDHDLLRRIWYALCSQFGVADIPTELDKLNVYIEKIKGDVAAGVSEVFKYAVKPSEMDEVALYSEMCLIMHGRRTVQHFGVFKEFYKRLRLNDEPTEEDASNFYGDLISSYDFDYKERRYCRSGEGGCI